MKISKLIRLLFAATLVITIVSCGKQSSEESVTSAKVFIQKNQLDAAIIELKNAVLKSPDVPSSRLLLGQLNFKTGQLLAAEKELNKALELGSKVNEVLPLLSQVYYYSEQFEAASSLSVEGLTASQAISTVNLMRYLASLRNRAGDPPLELEKLVANLSELDKLLALSYRAFRAIDIKQSAELLQRLEQSNYRPVDTEYLQALLNNQQGDYASAAESFAKVNRLMPFINTVDFQEIEASIKAKLYEDAEKKTDILLKFNQEQPLLNLYKASIAYARNEYELALSSAEKAIHNGLDNATVRMIAGVSAFQLKSSEQAYSHLRNLSQRKNFHSDDVNRLLARLQLSFGYNTEAFDSLQSLEQLSKSDADLFSFTAAKLAMSGDFASATELLSEASDLDNDNNSVKLRQAALNFGKDEQQAIQLLKEVIEGDKDLDIGWMSLAIAHVRNGDKTAALEVSKQWSDIDKANGKTLEGIIYFRYQELNESLTALKAALSIEPEHLGANQYLLKIYDELDQPENILSTAQDILSFSPNNLQALIAIVNTANQLGQSTVIEAYLSALTDSDGDNRGPLAAIALSKRLNGEPEKAIKLLSNINDRGTLGNITLGDAYLQVGDNKSALASYENWRVKSPGSLFPVLRVIAAHELNEDIQNALNVTESALAMFPSNNTLKMLQLHYATKLNRTSEVNDLIKKLKTEDKKENAVMLPYYEGQMALNAREYEKAETLLSQTHSASPTYISAAMLAKAMIANNNIGQAKEMLEKQLNNGESVPGKFKNIVASFYTHIEEYEKAAGMYENLITKHGENPALLNNFAFNILMANGDLEMAKAVAVKAVGLAPENADILDTLAWIEFKSGQMGAAYINMSKAADMKPASNEINLHFAELLISMGNIRKAKDILDKVKRPTGVESNTLMQLRKSL